MTATGFGKTLDDLMDRRYIEKFERPERSYREAVEMAWENLEHNPEAQAILTDFAQTLERNLSPDKSNN